MGAFYNLKGRRELGIQIAKIILRNQLCYFDICYFLFLFAVLDESLNYIMLKIHSETLFL